MKKSWCVPSVAVLAIITICITLLVMPSIMKSTNIESFIDEISLYILYSLIILIEIGCFGSAICNVKNAWNLSRSICVIPAVIATAMFTFLIVWEVFNSFSSNLFMNIFVIIGEIIGIIAIAYGFILIFDAPAIPNTPNTTNGTYKLYGVGVHDYTKCLTSASLGITGTADKAFESMGWVSIPVFLPMIVIGGPIFLIFALFYGISYFASLAIMRVMIGIVKIRDSSVGRHRKEIICPICGEGMGKEGLYYTDGNEVFTKLRPGACGIVNSVSLSLHEYPCTVRRERWDGLESICSVCNETIQCEMKEADAVVISTVGSKNSGKTSLVYGAMDRIEKEISASSEYEMTYEDSSVMNDVHSFVSGSVNPTPIGKISPTTMFYKHDSDLIATGVYVYDISGLEFEANTERDFFQQHYSKSDGFVMTIDPWSIDDFANAMGKTQHDKDPNYMASTFIRICSQIMHLKPKDRVSTPLAIVISNVDDSDVMGAIGDYKSSDSVKNFIMKYDSNFVKLVEDRFSNVKYFATCNKPGISLYDETVANPVMWIVRRYKKNSLRSLL